jgi:uncharacterized protein DUF5916
MLPAICACLLTAVPAAAQPAMRGDTMRISRAAGRIVIDGDISDEGWRTATRIDKWYEGNPGDNTEPKVRNVGWVTYDDRALYAAFEFEDPNPGAIRAPYSDRDDISGGGTDYAGVILDARNTGHTGVLFLVTPRNVQYDSVLDDSSGEDSSPDFFWESASKITERGWTLEIRIPFSSLRYKNGANERWGIMLYRNYPRAYHYQFFSARMPHDSNCFICHENTLDGLERLPSGGHLVAAPYVSASEGAHVAEGPDRRFVSEPVKPHAGADVKFTPNADTAVDLTLKPDFSQIESDVAQISANERFALFYPEKRPFFLEGVDLFQMPIQAVYTRTITAPRWGARVTGKTAGLRYTLLVSDDEGGGSAILPGPTGSSFASQDFGSTVTIARAKRDIGLSFIGFLVTDRESHDGNGHSRVIGPDFQWRPSGHDVITGQWLYSHSRTPNDPAAAEEWTGQTLHSGAGLLQWSRSLKHFDTTDQYKELGDAFRADTGFVPQVGYREFVSFSGWTVRPKGFLSRERTFFNFQQQNFLAGGLISRQIEPGAGMDTRWGGFMQYRFTDERVLSGHQLFDRNRFNYIVFFSPSRRVSQVGLSGSVGQEVDFANSRLGHGPSNEVHLTLNPTNHLAFDMSAEIRSLYVDDGGVDRRLFRAQVSRVKSTYTFNARMFVRGIVQYVAQRNDPSLYTDPVAPKSGNLQGSALLAYKVNWQSVMFVGYGDTRELDEADRLQRQDRQFFVKLSYAFQK